MELNETIRWLIGRGIGLLIGTIVLLVVYRVGLTAIHRLVPTVINAQAAHLPSGSSSAEEIGKRIGTIEDLLLKLLRLGVLAGFVIMALAVFELYAIIAVIVLVVVAVVFATRDVVLDYVMGFLILVEGPYFKGDYVAVGGHPGTEGVVEEIGLRRTVLRDPTGASNAVSNGLIRLSTNLTRLYSVAVVDIHVLHADQLDVALATLSRIAGEIREDAAWADRFTADAPTNVWVTGIGMDGASVRLQMQVHTGAQGDVASELRRRLVAALASASIPTGRWDTPMSIVNQPYAPSPAP
jgi:moderate conductance mechanosensitive channel